MPWTPAVGGTLHRCLRIQIHQDGYHDILSQRNVDLVRPLLSTLDLSDGHFDLPPFLLHNDDPDPLPVFFRLELVGVVALEPEVLPTTLPLTQEPAGLGRLGLEAVEAALGPAEEVILEPGETRAFFVRMTSVGEPMLVGSDHYLDVLPFGNGQPLLVDGIQSGVRYIFAPPVRAYLPLVLR